MRMAAISHRGRLRSENQDRIVVDDAVLGSEVCGATELEVDPPTLLAVVDGMGGHPAGGVAAAAAADVLASGFRRLRTCEDVGRLVSQANDELYALMGRVPGLSGMGAAVAGVFAAPGGLAIFNVGDVRVYLHSGGYLMQASIDDRRPGDGGTLTQSLGGLHAQSPVQVHLSSEPYDRGTVLVASDGLFTQAPHARLVEAMADPPAVAAGRLLDEALTAGGRDNISLILLELSQHG